MRDSGLQWNVHEVVLVGASKHISEGQAMPHELSESSAARSRLWQQGAAVQIAVLTGEGPSQVLNLSARSSRVLYLDFSRISLGPVVDCMRDSGMHRNERV